MKAYGGGEHNRRGRKEFESEALMKIFQSHALYFGVADALIGTTVVLEKKRKFGDLYVLSNEFTL